MIAHQTPSSVLHNASCSQPAEVVREDIFSLLVVNILDPSLSQIASCLQQALGFCQVASPSFPDLRSVSSQWGQCPSYVINV